MRFMSERFYSDARMYDRLFPGGEPAIDFYRPEADRQGGSVLELGCGTGRKLIPIASDGHPCTGLELSSDMLTEAQRKADERALAVEWVQGDMRDFDLGRTFDLVFIAANTLLHLHGAADLLELRCIFPQELPLLLSLGGLRLVERFGDWSGRPFTGNAAIQLCVCESD
jgi:SAM-dependent methyltransferase